MKSESGASSKGWKRRIEACKKERKQRVDGPWKDNVAYRKLKPFGTASEIDRVAVPIDWSFSKAKIATLYSQTPQVQLTPKHPRYAPAVPVFAKEPQFSDLAQRVKQAFFTQLAMPALSPDDIAVLRQRFESVRTQHYPFDFGATDHHLQNRDLLAAPKYHVLFRLWRKEGDAALAGLASDAIQAAVRAEAGRIETLELGHRYGHLSPLAAIA